VGAGWTKKKKKKKKREMWYRVMIM